jgi:hypothetical protein
VTSYKNELHLALSLKLFKKCVLKSQAPDDFDQIIKILRLGASKFN